MAKLKSGTTIGGSTAWHAGNDGSGSGLDADLLDGLNSAQFLRSDADDTTSGVITFGPNPGYSKYLKIGGNANHSDANSGSIGVTNGNLHIDAALGAFTTYLNFYDGTGGVAFGNGASGAVAWMGPDGDLWKGSADNSGSKYWHAGNDGTGSGLDADTVDGLQASSFLRSDTSDTATGALSFSGNVTYNSTSTVVFNTNTNTNPVYFSRSGSTSNEFTRIGRDDGTTYIYTKNDETSSAVRFDFENTDTESGGGASANTSFITLLGDINGASISVDGGTVWHSGNDGSGSGLDADLLDGQHASAFQTVAAPNAPSITSTTVVNETIELVFGQSSTSGVTRYEVWSDGATGSDYSLIAIIPAQDAAASMSVVDTSFDTGGTVAYRVYAVKNGVYSTAATTTKSFTIPSLDVTNMSVVASITNYDIQYDLPETRFLDHIEIYKDAETTLGALSRTGAALVYSGSSDNFTFNVSAADIEKYHQFWVECVSV